MKKIIPLLILASATLPGALAQQVIDYDFRTKKLDSITFVKLGRHTSLRLNNINRFLYDVSITAKQTEFHTDVPPVFGQILKTEQLETSEVKKEAEKVLDQEANKNNKVSDAIRNVATKREQVTVKEEQLAMYRIQLNSLIDQVDPASIPQENSENIANLEGKIKELNTEIDQQKAKARELNDALDGEYTKIIGDLYLEALAVDQAFEQLESSKILKNRLVQLAMTDGLSYREARNRTDQVFSKYAFSADPEQLLTAFEKACKKFKASYQFFLVNSVVLKKFKDEGEMKASVEPLLSEVQSLKKIVSNANYPELFQNIHTLFSELRNRNNYTVVSDPVQAEKDVLVFDVKITPRNNAVPLSPSETRAFATKVKVKGGVKIDFSTGIFITSGLHNMEYSLSAVDGVKSTIKEGKNNNLVQPLPGALMHVSPRCLGAVKPGFSFGLGLTSTDISEATIVAGPSLIIGSKERFIISSGLAIGRVNYLKSGYSLETEYETAKINAELTQKVTRLGWFLSFTYNLTNKEKE